MQDWKIQDRKMNVPVLMQAHTLAKAGDQLLDRILWQFVSYLQ